MQITSVAIWRLLPYVMKAPLSLNDVCCLVPAWFGVSATMALGAFTAECTGTWSAGVNEPSPQSHAHPPALVDVRLTTVTH